MAWHCSMSLITSQLQAHWSTDKRPLLDRGSLGHSPAHADVISNFKTNQKLKIVKPTWTMWLAVWEWGHCEAHYCERKGRAWTRGAPFSAVTACLPCPTPAALCGAFPSVSRTPLCDDPQWKCPPKGFVWKCFGAHLSGKNVFTEKFKLKLGHSKGTQNQMQIKRLQMQIVLFKGLFWKENYRQTSWGGTKWLTGLSKKPSQREFYCMEGFPIVWS